MADNFRTMRRIPFSFLWTSPLHKKLWLAGGAMGLFIVTMMITNHFMSDERALRSADVGMDFIAFYTAGDFVCEGRTEDLYNLKAIRAHEQSVAASGGVNIGNGFGPWWNPPFYAWVFVPLSRLEFPAAKWTWMAINITCVLLAIGLLMRMLGARDWRIAGLVPLLTLTSMAFVAALSHAQNTCTSLLILCTTVYFWRKAAAHDPEDGFNRNALLAGLCIGLLFYKPQLAVLVAGIMILHLGWATLGGVAVTGLALLLVNIFTLPGTLGDYLHKLPENVRYAQVFNEYMWDRHATIKAFFRLLFQGYAPGEASLLVNALYFAAAGALGLTLTAIAWRMRRMSFDRAHATDWLIAATIAATPLLMPFYFDYDLLLMAIPAVLVTRSALHRQGVEIKPIVRVWVAMAAWSYVNAPVAERLHVNGTVICLSLLAVLIVQRAWRAASVTPRELATPRIAPLSHAA